MPVRVKLRAGLVLAFLATLIAIAFSLNWHVPGPRSDADYDLIPGKITPVLVYRHADFSFAGGSTIPASGWVRGALPDFRLLPKTRMNHIDRPQFWSRIRFDRARFGSHAIALSIDSIREDYVVYLNGAALYRSQGERSAWTFGWNHPLFVPLPPAMLRDGANEIVVRVETTSPILLGIGTVSVGSDTDIRSTFDRQYFFSNVAPQIINGYLLILTIGALSFWARRPGDRVFGWLALVGLVWLFRNLHYFVQSSIIDPASFWTISTDSIFALKAVVFCFAAAYFMLAEARRIQLVILALCVVEIVSRHLLVADNRSELPSFLLTVPVTIFMIVAMLRTCLKDSNFRHWTMFAAIIASLIFSFHDLIFSFNISNGVGLFLQPYGGLLIFMAFDVALTSRLQNALIDVEDVNLKLEARVAEVTASLQQSETARAELQVALAVDGERERIMRDIHDGIGSSLLTALTRAKRRNESPETIATLSRSLTDLRIGVDSLEPIDGDVVALLANLRHRMERELKGAGVTFIWKVNHAPPLPWLDPIGALHILRILQEAVGNALIHANATNIEVSCGAHDDEGDAGVLIEIRDRGEGFDLQSAPRGKGLENMAARAETICARFWCKSEVGAGSTIALWLPLMRDKFDG